MPSGENGRSNKSPIYSSNWNLDLPCRSCLDGRIKARRINFNLLDAASHCTLWPLEGLTLRHVRHHGLLVSLKTLLPVKEYTIRFMRPNMIAIVSGLGNLGLFKIGGSKWKCHIREEKYVNLTFYKVKMYAVRKEFNQVDIFEIDDNLELSLVGAIDSSEVISNSLPPPFQVYLVVDSKDNNLLLVLQHRKMFDSFLMAIEFEIFKTRDGEQLVKVDTLDDQIVLLSDTCSEIIDFKDCPPSTFFQGNQICFTTGEFHHDFGIYSFNEHYVRWLMPFRGEMYCLHWMIPRFKSQCTCESHPAC
ncbi:hypothetical protein K1719_036913 [Acacia pycnantha]|nr:hypothetical protein K1719_036913 [Acacia pycnantha]